jgi:hypothetical protein
VAKKTNTPSAGLVTQVTNAVSDPEHELSEETVARIIVAYDTFRLGADVGTQMQNPDTGALAVRVDDPERGAVWKTISSSGEVGYDTQPSLPTPWTDLAPPPPVEEAVTV